MKSRHNYFYIISLLLLIVIISSGLSFSRYISTLSNTGDSSIIITSNEYNLDVNWDDEPNTEQYPGISGQTYNFTLENTKNKDLNYKINIGLSWNDETPVIGLKVPLKMKLYIVNGGVPELVKESQSNTLFYKPTVPIGGDENIEFKLKWNWDATDNSYKYANKKIDVKIDVDATQR